MNTAKTDSTGTVRWPVDVDSFAVEPILELPTVAIDVAAKTKVTVTESVVEFAVALTAKIGQSANSVADTFAVDTVSSVVDIVRCLAN